MSGEREKETAIRIIKIMLRRRSKEKGIEKPTDKWLTEKAEQVYREETQQNNQKSEE